MEISLEPGKYVVAVSGGNDSVVLLHLLTANQRQTPNYQFVVAHFDHGIRDDSLADRRFVEDMAEHYGLPFEYGEGHLGLGASEAKARAARYRFLHEVRNKTDARAILTAHHEDDLIETAFINILRGTGRKGLSSLGSSQQIKRPLLDTTKRDIQDYAQKYKLMWHEDSTNLDNSYLRNYIRNKTLPNLTTEHRARLMDILILARQRNDQIDAMLQNLLNEQQSEINRAWFIALPHTVAREVLGHWLRKQGISFDRPAIERLVAALKTLPVGAKADIAGGWYFIIGKEDIRLREQSSV